MTNNSANIIEINYKHDKNNQHNDKMNIIIKSNKIKKYEIENISSLMASSDSSEENNSLTSDSSITESEFNIN